MPARIAGTGRYLPAEILTNEALAERVATSDEWIRSRTGIAERRIAAPGEHTADLAEHAEKGRKPQIERAAANLAMAVGQRLTQGGEVELPHDIAAILDEAARKIERL